MWITSQRRLAAFVVSGTVAAGGLVALSSPSAVPAAAPEAPSASAASVALSQGFVGTLFDVDALSSTQAWAVGNVYNSQLAVERTLVQRWDGSSWVRVPSPSTAKTNNAVLSAVSARSATDVWAVGHYQPKNGGPSKTLALHWDGTAWSRVPIPSPYFSSTLDDVEVVTATDAWAVGHTATPNVGRGKPLIVHWDGTSWSVVPSSMVVTTDGRLSAISAISTNDVWAVGGNEGGSFGRTQTFAEHWNGHTWSTVATPNPPNISQLADVSAVSATDVWAVGATITSEAQNLIEHWDGVRWSVVPDDPAAGPPKVSSLRAVSALSSSLAWAVGSYQTDTNESGLLTEKWNGTAWTLQPSVNPGRAPSLWGTDVVSASDAWAVGRFYSPSGFPKTFIEHWDGTAWTRFE